MTPLTKSKPNSRPSRIAGFSQQSELYALGTRWQIDLPAGAFDITQTATAIEQRLEVFEHAFSRFRPDSLITQLATTGGSATMPVEFAKLWQLYRHLSDLSGGAFTPLIGSVLVDAGYDATYSLETKQVQPPPGWEILDYQPPVLSVAKPVWLDFGAAGKGLAVDIVSELLQAQGYQEFCVDAGGDIRHHQVNHSLTIGLEHPLNTDLAFGEITLKNQSLCASAGNRRAWGKFTHIMHPATVQSPQNVLATWVMSQQTSEADALATCLFFASPKLLKQDFDFEYAILHANQSFEFSPHLPVRLYR